MADVNDDESIDLHDAILALQVSSDLDPAGNVQIQADVNGDNRIGTAEAVFVLQYLSGTSH